MATIVFENGEPRTEPVMLRSDVVIPPGIETLADFRAWALSDNFPQRGRIDYIQGCIEVDMSPEDFFMHGTPKTEIIAVLAYRNRQLKLGYLLSDQTRISNASADLSAEPDVIFFSKETLQLGRARLVPKVTEEDDRYVEVEGMADLVVEIVSDSSENKDRRRLPREYFTAGVRGFWLIDVRRPDIQFQIHSRGDKNFEPMAVDADGFQTSAVMGCRFRFERTRDESNYPQYTLIESP